MAFKNIELRVYKGNITLTELAEEMDLHKNTLNKWFNQKEMNEVRKRRVTEAVDRINERKAQQ